MSSDESTCYYILDNYFYELFGVDGAGKRDVDSHGELTSMKKLPQILNPVPDT